MDFQFCNWQNDIPAPILFVSLFDNKYKWVDKLPYYYFVEYSGFELSQEEVEQLNARSCYKGLMNHLLKLRLVEV